MLYIDNVGNSSIRFGDAVGGGTHPKTLPNNMVARSSEVVGNDTTGRVWINDTDSNANILNCYDPAQITLNGVIYGDASNFVMQFNAMIAGTTFVTTTTTTSAVTTTTTAPVTTTTTTV